MGDTLVMKKYIVANLVVTNSDNKFRYALDLDATVDMRPVLMTDSIEKLVKDLPEVETLEEKLKLMELTPINKIVNCDDVDDVIATNVIQSLDPANIIAVATTEKGAMVIYPPALERYWDDIVKNTIYIYEVV